MRTASANVQTRARTINAEARRSHARAVRSEHTGDVDQSTLAQMDLGTLERRCAIESERFYRGQPHDTRYAYELFRRALVERSEVAWEAIFNHYHSLVESWVRRSGAFASSGESS